jgi:hypothetical protein
MVVAASWANAMGATSARAMPRSMPRASTAFVAGHLFVSSADAGALGGANVYRYPLHDGVPAARPDYVYFFGSSQGSLPSFTVNANGVASFMRCCFGVETYGREGTFEFSWAVTQPFYDMAFPGMVVNGARVLVDYVTLPSSQRRARGFATSPCAGPNAPASGIDIYGPFDPANFGRPLLGCFPVTQTAPDFAGMVVNANELYFPNASKVDVYGPLTGNPTLLRTLTGPSFKAIASLAIDDDGKLYTLDAQQYSYVAVYDAQGSGTVKALRTVAYPSEERWNGNVAVDSRYLYVGGNEAVLVYPKGTSGRRAPLATLAVPASTGPTEGPWIAIGP